MTPAAEQSYDQTPPPRLEAATAICSCADWYAEGESRVVECDGVRVVIKYVGRQGRRGRIVIEAPAGAVFS